MGQPTEPHRRIAGQFSLISIFIFTIVFAALSLSLGYLYRSIDDKQVAMGQFIIITAMSPLVTLSMVSFLFWLFRRSPTKHS